MGRSVEDGNKREEKPGKKCTEDGEEGTPFMFSTGII